MDDQATTIYTACSFQDITGQRTGKVVEILRYLERRVNSMVGIWEVDDLVPQDDQIEDQRPDAHLVSGPSLAGQGLLQEDVDGMLSSTLDDIDFVEVTPGAEQSTPDRVSEPASENPDTPELDARSTAGQPEAPAAGEQAPVATAAPPSAGAGAVAAEHFTKPDDLDMSELNPTKTSALFS